MVVFLVVLIGGYALWKLLVPENNGTEEVTTASSKPSIEFQKAEVKDIDSITVVTESGELKLKPEFVMPSPTPTVEAETGQTTSALPITGAAEKTEETVAEVLQWSVEDAEFDTSYLSQQFVDDLGNGLLNISVAEYIGKKSGNELASYGVNDEKNHTIYKYKNGDEVKIIVGDSLSAVNQEQYYAYNEKTEELVVISRAADFLQANYLDLFEKNIMNFTFEDIKEFELVRSTEDFNIAAVKTDNEVSEENAYANVQWEVTSPIRWTGSDRNISTLLTELTSIQANEYFELTDSLEKYGLENPNYKITLRTDDETLTLNVGQALSNDLTYGMLEDSDYVFTFNRSMLSQIGMPSLDFYDTFAALINISSVSKMNLNLEGKEYTAEIDYPTQKEKDKAKESGLDAPEEVFIFNGEDANIENESGDNLFSRFYSSVIGITVDGFATDEKATLDDVKYRVQFELKDAKEDVVVEFSKRDENSLYLFKNGDFTGFYVNNSKFKDNGDLDSPTVELAIKTLLNEMEK